MLFGLDRMNFKMLLLKILMLLDFLVCGSRLCHSFIVEGEKEFLKKLYFVQSWGIFLSFVGNIWCFVRGLMEKDNSVTGC